MTQYMHKAMMSKEKKFYSGMVLGKMFKVPPLTLNKLLSGRKYMGGAELNKYPEEMARKGIEIKKRKSTKLGGCRQSEEPRPSTSTSMVTSDLKPRKGAMQHD